MNGMNLLEKSGYEIKRFADLDLPSQMAIVWYMAFDGEAWAHIDYERTAVFDREAAKDSIRTAMPKYVAEHGSTLFGVSKFSVEDFKIAIMAGGEVAEDFTSWESYQDWYVGCSDVPSHGNIGRWPAIVSGFDDEILQDGWHRTHSYIRNGDTDIPVIFYPEEKHLKNIT